MENQTQVQPQVQMVQQPQAVPSISQLMGKDATKKRFNDLLGKKAPGFISSVLSVANSYVLKDADPNTILSASVVAATLDLPINPNLGFAYIVPYNDKRKGKQAQFQMGYKGFIQLAQRSSQVEILNTIEVREGELVSHDMLTGEIELKMCMKDRPNKKVIGYAAYIKLVNGFHKALYMTMEEMKAHAAKYSQSFRNDKYGTSLWNTEFDMMAKKTVLKLLLSKYAPLTIDMQQAIFYDQAVVNDVTNVGTENFDDHDVTYVDNDSEAVAEPSAEMESNRERVEQAMAMQ